MERNDLILTSVFERHLKDALGIQIRNYEHLDMTDPFYLFENLVGAVGLAGSLQGPLHYGAPQRIDDDLLQVPEILIERRDEAAVDSAVASIMRVLWNAFGFTERPATPLGTSASLLLCLQLQQYYPLEHVQL